MLISTVVAALVLLVCAGYVVLRMMTTTRQGLEFATPQDGVKTIYLDIREDTVRNLYIQFVDGSVAEVVTTRAV